MIFINKKTMNTKLLLDNYLGKNTRVSEKDMGDGTKQVCDLDTGRLLYFKNERRTNRTC
jgi:hypothetical protein